MGVILEIIAAFIFEVLLLGIFKWIFWLFRKIGLLLRYTIYFLIGKKKELKYLDRRQHEPNWFSQRGINTFIGFVIAVLLILYLIYR